MVCFPNIGGNRRIFAALLLGMVAMTGCADKDVLAHIPPFARAPYQAFSRAALVQIALREWRLFGETTGEDDDDEAVKPEREQGLWQRVGEYWWLGLNRDAPEVTWTGKHDARGKIFPPEDDGNFAWSAAFISYAMRIAGAGTAFPYAADHAHYINAAKRMAPGTERGWLIVAERPEVYAPLPGDLICHGRGRAAGVRFDDLPTPALFPAHCDIVVDTSKRGEIGVIGGNIRDSVTLRRIPATVDGKLARADGTVLDQDRAWFAVLRVLEPAAGG